MALDYWMEEEPPEPKESETKRMIFSMIYLRERVANTANIAPKIMTGIKYFFVHLFLIALTRKTINKTSTGTKIRIAATRATELKNATIAPPISIIKIILLGCMNK